MLDLRSLDLNMWMVPMRSCSTVYLSQLLAAPKEEGIAGPDLECSLDNSICKDPGLPEDTRETMG